MILTVAEEHSLIFSGAYFDETGMRRKPLKELGCKRNNQVRAYLKWNGKGIKALDLFRVLYVNNNDIKRYLKLSPDVEWIWIDGNFIDDKVMHIIAENVNHLRKIVFNRCQKISKKGLDVLKVKFPDAEVDCLNCYQVNKDFEAIYSGDP